MGFNIEMLHEFREFRLNSAKMKAILKECFCQISHNIQYMCFPGKYLK